MTEVKPRVAVVVAIYNVAKYLARCFDSIRGQQLKEIEIILVNDGSTDESGKMCVDYAKTDSRVIVHHKTNGGLFSARNAGLVLVTAPYVYFMDGDDWIEADLLSTAYKTAVDTDADIVMFGHFKEIAMENGGVNVISTLPPQVSFTNRDEVAVHMWRLFRAGCGFAVWEQLIRTASIISNKIEFPPHRRGTDMGFLLNLYKHINSLQTLPKAFYHYNAFNTANKFNPQLIETHVRLFHNYLDAFQNGRELNPYTTQLFILWFAHVIPTNVVNNKTLTYKDKVSFLRKYFTEPQVKNWIQQYKVSQCTGVVTKMMMAILKLRSASIIYATTRFNITVKNNFAFNYKKLFYSGS